MVTQAALSNLPAELIWMVTGYLCREDLAHLSLTLNAFAVTVEKCLYATVDLNISINPHLRLIYLLRAICR